ncbi:MAG: Asp-tRNA(Asn)/Glu-tRNA(Gln) amidotransferase subunit GatC [Candidatus Aenigmarchaeota archaeon]|nr:Asp-tRNA(Asn)/Glu-tRNA(Gln) amidotransferase subunit GatC [Candidatus Aenigmarchaeota archaeon]
MDKDTIKKVADVARLNLTDEEISDFSRDFDGILEQFSELHKEKLEEFEEEEKSAVLRKDESVLDFTVSEKILDNAPDKENKLYKVPKGSK